MQDVCDDIALKTPFAFAGFGLGGIELHASEA